MIVLGIALVLAGVLFLTVGSIVSDAIAAGSQGCSSGHCPTVDPGAWIDWIGIPFLAIGILLLAIGLWWALR